MKIEILTHAEAGAQVRLDGALIADIAIGEAITAAERDAELRKLRPLFVSVRFLSDFMATLSKLSGNDLVRFCEGVSDGARKVLIPHPMEPTTVPGILKSYEHHYQTGYRFGEAFVSLGRQPVYNPMDDPAF